MSTLHNSVDTVNAAATAIVTADSRVQPTTLQKRRWGSCWSQYWCFGSYKHHKRIGHASIAPESTAAGAPSPLISDSQNSSTTIVIPFIAPPSSPASFLQSDPPSSTQTPTTTTGILSLASLSFNTSGAASIFAIGPYAYETQLVSPPVFSTMNTEPSTANFTPPPEPVQFTTPSSPEVPFAQLLTSSLATCRTKGGTNQMFSLSQYEYQPYQLYSGNPGSPGSQFISRASSIPNSGTCSPFPEKRSVIEIRVGEVPKFLNYEYFNNNRKRGSRLGSGSVTPSNWGSRMDSGSLTPNGWESRLDSGSLTPTAVEPFSQISDVMASLSDDIMIGHRVSFELSSEHVLACSPLDTLGSDVSADMSKRTESSSKDFNFNNANGEATDKRNNNCEWLAPQKNWTFFPMLQPEVS